MDRQAQRDIRRKLNCLIFAQEQGSNVLACRKFGVSKSSFYRWKARYRDQGEEDPEKRGNYPGGWTMPQLPRKETEPCGSPCKTISLVATGA